MNAKTMHSSEAALRGALTTLCERWKQMAATEAATLPDDFFVPETPGIERAAARAHVYRRAADDVNHVLHTGLIPHDLMNDEELDEHGIPEEPTS